MPVFVAVFCFLCHVSCFSLPLRHTHTNTLKHLVVVIFTCNMTGLNNYISAYCYILTCFLIVFIILVCNYYVFFINCVDYSSLSYFSYNPSTISVLVTSWSKFVTFGILATLSHVNTIEIASIKLITVQPY